MLRYLSSMNKMPDIQEQIKGLKLQFRSLMNGIVSTSMRNKGLNYKVNFGVELGRLREIAASIPAHHDLAQALWKEDVRECRILAAMLQPSATFYPEIADIWVESMRFPEEAELTVMHLFARLPYASDKAFCWIADEREMFQTCGFLLLARLFMNGGLCNEPSECEYLDQAVTALHSPSSMVRKAAQTSLSKFANLGEREEALISDLIANNTFPQA
ncbi:MAG: DNA alkylation repair protein [Bacteroidaceae bacterium]